MSKLDTSIGKNLEWPSAETTELINTITYYNYGKILNSNCCDLSNSNRLAICTDKCLFVLNFNLNWPSSIVNSSPAKFLNELNQTHQSTGTKSKPNAQIDSWIQDLIETRNEAFYVNIIRSVQRSKLVFKLYKNFFNTDEAQNYKRKSFNKQIKDVINNKNSKLSDNDPEIDDEPENKKTRKLRDGSYQVQTISNPKSPESKKNLISLREANKDQYAFHKNLYEQNRLFDVYYFEYLSYLNTSLLQQKENNSVSNAFDGFKYTKWNSSLNLNILCAITNCNQLVLFDCSRLNVENTVNITNQENTQNNLDLTDLDMSSLKTSSESYKKVFDLKTKSKQINLTEFWILKYCSYLIDLKPRSLNDFVANMNRIVPVCVCWSSVIQLKPGLEGELLFVAFKSNEIGVFLVHNHYNDFEIELVDCVDMRKYLAEENKEVDELVNVDLTEELNQTQVSSISFSSIESYGLLTIGLLNGSVVLTKISLNSERLLSFIDESTTKPKITNEHKFIKLNNIRIYGKIQKTELVSLEFMKSASSLLVIQTENRLIFDILVYDLKKDELKSNSDEKPLNYQLNENNYAEYMRDSASNETNQIIKSFTRLIGFKIVTKQVRWKKEEDLNLEFLLMLENSFVEYLKLTLKVEHGAIKLKLADKILVNDTTQVKFDTLQTYRNKLVKSESVDPQQHHLNELKSDQGSLLFKTSKQMFLSTNGYLLFQIYDFSKSVLIQKKPPQFQINVYRIKPANDLTKNFLCTNKSEIKDNAQLVDLAKTYLKRELIKRNDLLWVFKRQLYFNYDSFFNETHFEYLYSSFKSSNKYLNLNKEALKDMRLDDVLSSFKRLRILSLLVGNYFEIASSFDAYNSKVVREVNDEDGDDDDDEDDEDDDESDDSDSDESDKPNKKSESSGEKAKKSSDLYEIIHESEKSTIIKTPDYYKSLFREYTLSIFKYHSLDIILTAYTIGYENLSNHERLLLLVLSEFSMKKNFFSNLNLEIFNRSLGGKKLTQKSLEEWLNSKFLNINLAECSPTKSPSKNENSGLLNLLNSLNCDLCANKLKIDSSLDLNLVKCELGHSMNRCQKSLLNLNNFKYNKCSVCNSTWNYFDRSDYPNFHQLTQYQNFCLFCD